jgi:hypothetical protein
MQLTPHFADTELGVAGVDAQIVSNARQLCIELLEPIRTKFGATILSDGYRNPADNKAAGGAADSQHLYLGLNSAADMTGFQSADLETVFDWIRLESGLPFDEVILEFHPGTEQPRCIHISYNGALARQRRKALTGETNGAGTYTAVAVGP